MYRRLYERVISEHIDSWYRDLSPDEEFLQVSTRGKVLKFVQEIRKIFREATTEILIRLARVRVILPLSLNQMFSSFLSLTV